MTVPAINPVVLNQALATPQAKQGTALTPMLSPGTITPVSPSTSSMLTKAAKVSLGAGLNITKRLYNGVADVVKMFLPPQLGKTIKHTMLWTAGLSAFSFVLTGPFHLPALPAFALASLGFDMAWTFVGGLLRSPNQAYAQAPAANLVPAQTVAQPPATPKKSFGLGVFNPFAALAASPPPASQSVAPTKA